MQKSKFKNFGELKAYFDVIYDILDSFAMNEGIVFDSALYALLDSARIILSRVPSHFDEYSYDKE